MAVNAKLIQAWIRGEWVPVPSMNGVRCPVCGGNIPPEDDDPQPWPFNLHTYEPDPPEPERDAFGSLTSKTKRF